MLFTRSASRGASSSRKSPILLLSVSILLSASTIQKFLQVNAQLPEDMQRELNQNLAEQARIQAMRQKHQQQIQARAGNNGARAAAAPSPQQPQKHDPNNYSFQQVSPPIQYSYYQPYGDAAANQNPQQQPAQARSDGSNAAAAAGAPKVDFDLNNLNIELPQPQAQVAANNNNNGLSSSQPSLAPSFTGAGGLPVLPAAAQGPDAFAPTGQAPLAPQARVQQGPPLTEADFKDITGGDNYGAPGGSDFGLGDAASGAGANRRQSNNNNMVPDLGGASNTDNQLREFGMPDEAPQQRPAARRSNADPSGLMGGMNLGDFGGIMGGSSGGQRSRQQPRVDDGFGGFGGGAGGNGAPGGADFDFASQPSSERGDQAAATMNGGAPGSLQSLLGGGFPGLGGDQGGNMGLDGLARGQAPESQLPADGSSGGDNGDPTANGMSSRGRADDGAIDVADLGDKSDQFSGADLGGFEQPSAKNDQDFNYAAAAEQQPRTVPYPDGGPQFVGSILAITQPNSLTQTRYSALPDKGTFQDYPAYQSGGNDFSAVQSVVANTPRARPPGPDRYGRPAPSELAPEFRQLGSGYDYSRAMPRSSREGQDGFGIESEPTFVEEEIL